MDELGVFMVSLFKAADVEEGKRQEYLSAFLGDFYQVLLQRLLIDKKYEKLAIKFAIEWPQKRHAEDLLVLIKETMEQVDQEDFVREWKPSLDVAIKNLARNMVLIEGLDDKFGKRFEKTYQSQLEKFRLRENLKDDEKKAADKLQELI